MPAAPSVAILPRVMNDSAPSPRKPAFSPVWLLYNSLFPVAFAFLLPKYLLRMRKRGGYAADFAQRFARYKPETAALLDAPGRPVWIQAVSVGELAVALTFMEAARRRHPGIRFVLSTNTSTAHAIALKKISAPDVVLYFPLDLPGIVKKALARIRPQAVVLVENEMWPNLIRYAAAAGIPVHIVNGRISFHSYKGYKKLRFITKKLLPLMSSFSMQSQGDADRLTDLGAPADRLHVTGSAKYDLAPTPPEAADAARAYLRWIRPGHGPVVAAGSTWPGEEDILLDWFQAARAAHPDALLVLVPRHAERRAEVLAAIESRHLPYVQKSVAPLPADPAATPPPSAEPPAVLLADTTGELRGFYAAADIVFVGKSLTQTGGQNPIEPAVDARPVVVGPHMENFPAISGDFAQADAWAQAADAAELAQILTRWLDDPAAARETGRRAAALVAAHAGAADLMAEHALP